MQETAVGSFTQCDHHPERGLSFNPVYRVARICIGRNFEAPLDSGRKAGGTTNPDCFGDEPVRHAESLHPPVATVTIPRIFHEWRGHHLRGPRGY